MGKWVARHAGTILTRDRDGPPPTGNAASREGALGGSRPKSQIEMLRLVKRSRRYAGPMLGSAAGGVFTGHVWTSS